MTRPKKCPKLSKKHPKLKVIIHAFRLSWGSSSERHRMRPRDMGGHCKGVMGLGTNLCVPLCSFHDNLGFHEKWTYEVFGGFFRQHKWCQALGQHYKSRQPVKVQKCDQARKSPKMSQKQPKLKVIIHLFWLSRGPSYGCQGMSPSNMGGHWKGVMWLGTNM